MDEEQIEKYYQDISREADSGQDLMMALKSEPTFKELMNCNTGSDDRHWVKDEAEYDDRTTASLGEIARIVFTK